MCSSLDTTKVPKRGRHETGAGADRRYGDHDCKLGAHEVPEACKTVSLSPAGKVQAWSIVDGGNLGGLDVVYPIPKVGLLEATGGLRKASEDATRRVAMSSGDDTAEGLVVKIMKVLLFTSLGQCDDRLTAGVCTFRVDDRGKNEAH